MVVAHGTRALYCWMRTRDCWTSSECVTDQSISLNTWFSAAKTSHYDISTWKQRIVLLITYQRLLNSFWIVKCEPQTVQVRLNAKQICHSDSLTDWVLQVLHTIAAGHGARAELLGNIVLYVKTNVSWHNYRRCTSQSQSLTLVHRNGSLG